MKPRAIHADGVITGDREAIRDGAVVVDAEGVVLDVGTAASVLPRHAGCEVTRVRGAVMPGLVNAHVHVELSALRGRAPGGAGFFPWLETMLAKRDEAAAEELASAAESAVAELDAAGTSAVGEVSNTLLAVRALARRGFAGCVFHEVLGLRREQARERVASLARAVEGAVGAWPSADLAYAPAPHALYSLHVEAVRALLDLVRSRGARTSIHLAEHAAERHALEAGEGPFAGWLAAKAGLAPAEYPWPRQSPIALAESLGALARDVLAVHLTDARPEELARVAARGAPVVVCPRSNLHIERRLPPLVAMRHAGLEPALGTDSLASNASLDVLAEARALADRFPGIPPRELLQMATWNGARALGRPDLGRFATGSRPGIVAIEGELGDLTAAFVLRSVKAPRRWIVRRTGEAA
jgi:cytosine/adenosine deaminase-related metal-dependent hydrolase